MRFQEVVSVWDKNVNCWISEVKQYEETMANEQSQNGRGKYQIDDITYAIWNLNLGIWNLNFEQVTWKFWLKRIVVALACAKCSKLIIFKENIISVQQLPLCPIVFCILNCFDGVAFQDAVCEECFSIPLRCLRLNFFCYCF